MFDQKTFKHIFTETLSHVDDVVFWLDSSLKLLFSNHPRFEQLYERHDTVDLDISQVAQLNAEQSWSDLLSEVGDEPRFVDGILLDELHPHGTYFKVARASATTESIGRQPHWIVVGRDLVNSYQHEVARDEAQELTQALRQIEQVNAELAKTAQAKDEFLASMSHELRTPLNAILGLCEALLEGVYGKLDADQHQPIRQVFSNGHHLLSVISDILDLSKLRAGGISLSLNDVDVEACCFEAIQVFRAEMQKKRLTINVSIEGVYLLNADERWFKQVLMNLLSNAVKFTPADRKLGVVVSESPEIGFLRVTVWDEGIGIKEEDLPRLFQTFVQLDTSLARAYEGTGLGLSIVSSVMQLHGGSISVESARGQGSKFHLDFPWLPEKGVLAHEDFIPAPSHLNSVLLVEDSEVDADRIKRFLSELDTEIYWDQRGSDAISLALQHGPDIIILDLFLPESSGWEILKKLKSDPRLASIPVLVCSVLERDDHRPEIKLVEGYLQKPFSRRALEHSLRDVLIKSSEIDVADPKKTLVISAQEQAQSGSLPLTQTDTPVIPLPGDEPSASLHNEPTTQPRILIVDDNLSNIQLVNDYLRRKGYFILTAEDGYQAVQVARAHLPDLILMDIQMPHMDGIEATGHIKSDPRVSHIPIFALTALAMPGDRERCLDAGMSDYFTKPVSLRGLYKKIKETLEVKS